MNVILKRSYNFRLYPDLLVSIEHFFFAHSARTVEYTDCTSAEE